MNTDLGQTARFSTPSTQRSNTQLRGSDSSVVDRQVREPVDTQDGYSTSKSGDSQRPVALNSAFRTIDISPSRSVEIPAIEQSERNQNLSLSEIIKSQRGQQEFTGPCNIFLEGIEEPFNLAEKDPITQTSFLKMFADNPQKHLFLLACCESDNKGSQTNKYQSLMTPIGMDKWLHTEQARSGEGIHDATNRQLFKSISIVLMNIDQIEPSNQDKRLVPLHRFDFSNKLRKEETDHRLSTMMKMLNTAYNRGDDQLRNDEWMLRGILLQGLELQGNDSQEEDVSVGRELIEHTLSFTDEKKKLLVALFNSFQNLDFNKSESLKKLFFDDPTIEGYF